MGRIYQQTFIDTYSKVAFAKLYDIKTPRVQSRDVTQDARRGGRAARSWPGLRSDDRPDEARLCGLEYVPVSLATPTWRLLRAAFIAQLLLFGDVG